MAYVCEVLDSSNVCIQWAVYQPWYQALAITKSQMYALASSIIGIYGVVIAFILFNNFAKRA